MGEIATSIAVDAVGNSYITGEYTGETDFDPSGGEFLLTAEGISDVFVASYTSGGGLRFAIGMGGTERDRGLDIAIDAAGNSYVSGAFRGTVDFDPGVGTATLVSAGNEDLFLASYDDSGGYRYAIGVGSAFTDLGRGVAVDANGNAFVTGSFFADTVDFDPGPGTLLVTSAGNRGSLPSQATTARARCASHSASARPNDDIGTEPAIDGSGDVLITGSFVNTIDFDPGPGEVLLGTNGTKALVARYSNTGSYEDAYFFGPVGNGSSVGQDIALDPSGRPSVIGDFSGTVDFDPGADVVTLLANGSTDAFFSSYTNAAPVPLFGPIGVAAGASLLALLGWRRVRRRG